MRKGPKLFYIFLLSLLLLPAFSPAIQASNDFIDMERWQNPAELDDFLHLFAELEYKLFDALETVTLRYFYEGQEELDGVKVDRVIMEGSLPEQEDQKLVFWIDDEGNLVKVMDEMSQEEIPPMFAGLVTMAFFVPFYIIEDLQIEALENGELNDMKITPTETQDQLVGGLEATVTTYTAIFKDDDGADQEATYRIGDFGDFQMMVSFKIPNAEEPDREYIEFEITKITRR